MIYGIGVDIVKIDRITASLERFGERLARRILSEQEFPEYQAALNPADFLAKRFAAKEALSKALGTGFRNGLSLRQISVEHDSLGKPFFRCSGHAQRMFEQFTIHRSHLTLSDEANYALAYVTLETHHINGPNVQL